MGPTRRFVVATCRRDTWVVGRGCGAHARGEVHRGRAGLAAFLFITYAISRRAIAEGAVAAAGELGEEVERLTSIWRSGEGERVGRRGVVGGRSGRRRGRRRPGWWRAATEL